jgi:HK97 family phage portal protein
MFSGGPQWGIYADGTIPPNTWTGSTNSSGQSVTPDSALRIATVWACVQLVSDYIAGMDVATVTKKPDGEVTRNGQQPPLLAQPWPEFTQYEWFFALQASLMLRGNAFGRKMDFDSRGYPRMIQPISADQVGVARVKGELSYKFGNEKVSTDEVFHLRAFTIPGHDTGLSPIVNFARTMGINLAAEDYIARFFGDGAHPTAVLESDQTIDKTQADTLLDRIRRKFMGGSREPIVLGAGTKWTQIQVSPAETQFLETIRATDIQIAKVFGLGVAPELVAASISGQNITYANVESRGIDLQTFGIMPWTTRWAQALTPLVPAKPSVVAFDLEAKLKVDTLTRTQADSIAMRSGWKSADDVRRPIGLPPIPDDAGAQYNWPPYNVKSDVTAEDVAADDGTDEPSIPAPPAPVPVPARSTNGTHN